MKTAEQIERDEQLTSYINRHYEDGTTMRSLPHPLEFDLSWKLREEILGQSDPSVDIVLRLMDAGANPYSSYGAVKAQYDETIKLLENLLAHPDAIPEKDYETRLKIYEHMSDWVFENREKQINSKSLVPEAGQREVYDALRNAMRRKDYAAFKKIVPLITSELYLVKAIQKGLQRERGGELDMVNALFPLIHSEETFLQIGLEGPLGKQLHSIIPKKFQHFFEGVGYYDTPIMIENEKFNTGVKVNLFPDELRYKAPTIAPQPANTAPLYTPSQSQLSPNTSPALAGPGGAGLYSNASMSPINPVTMQAAGTAGAVAATAAMLAAIPGVGTIAKKVVRSFQEQEDTRRGATKSPKTTPKQTPTELPVDAGKSYDNRSPEYYTGPDANAKYKTDKPDTSKRGR